MKIALNRPLTPDTGRLLGLLSDVVDRGWYTNFGPLESELTGKLADYLGVEHLLLVSNGTVALQVAMRTLGVTGPVATTPFSFVATTSVLIWEGLSPIFVDIDPATFNLDPVRLQTAPREVSAIMPVHVYGNPCDVEAIEDIARTRRVPVIYDAAHAFGSRVGDASVLKWGDAATLSFHATKLFHTVEGGAIVFRTREMLEKARSLINFGFGGSGSALGTGINAKLSEFHAATGLALLDRMDGVLAHRAELYDLYRSSLAGRVQFQDWHDSGGPTGAYMPVLFSNEAECIDVANGLEADGIGSRRYFHPSLNTLPALADLNTSCPESEDVASRVLCLPMHNELTGADVAVVSRKVCEIVDGIRCVD